MPTTMMLIYMVTGSVFAVLVIGWSLRTHQFEDQDRARFLALRDLSDQELSTRPKQRITASTVAVAVVVLGFAVTLGRMLYLVATAPR